MKILGKLGSQRASAQEGPLRIGDYKMLSAASAAPKIASLYAAAFRSGTLVLPYFTED
jgi:hypothetical protein